MRMLEKVLVALFVIGYLIKFSGINGGEFFIVLTINTLAILYFPFGILLFNSLTIKQFFKGAVKKISKKRIIISIAASYIFATALLGIMFGILKLDGAGFMLGLGIFGSAVIIIVALIGFSKNQKELFYQNMIIRSSLIMISSLIFHYY